MSDQDPTRTRCFALIGHAGDGKTSLAESLLFEAGVTSERGRVEDGSSCLDSSAEERTRKHTLASSAYSFEAAGVDAHLIDTPGDPNFQGDSQIVVQAVDGAILVVDGAHGPKVGTETMWRATERAGIPTVAFVNHVDQERFDLDATVASLQAMGLNAVPIVAATATGGGTELLDLLAGPPTTEAARAAHANLVEAVAETDDELLERYLEDGALEVDDLNRGLIAATRTRSIVPVLVGSARTGVGVAGVLSAIETLLPSPYEARPFRDANGAEIEALADAPFAARVFKTVIDRYAGKLSLIRVVSGTAKEGSTLWNATTETKERVGKLIRLAGADHRELAEAGPGALLAFAKLKDTHTGDTLTTERDGIALPAITIPHGVLSYAVSAANKADEDKVFASLAKVVEEDPVLALGRDTATGEFLLTGMGELQLRVTAERLKRLYDVDILLQTPKVPYRETLTRPAERVEGKLKKQSGGKGMFGVCTLTLEPLPRGSGLSFSDEIVGGAIPRNLIPAVEKGCREAALAGPLAGYPVVDVCVRCTDGKHHAVDSNEMAFKLAGSFAFRQAMAQGKPTLLEPVMTVEVTVPDVHLGDVMGDLSSRRGRVQGTESRGSSQVIKAEVPMAEMLEYASALTSLTGGKGAYHMEFSEYQEVPAQARDQIIADANTAAEAEA